MQPETSEAATNLEQLLQMGIRTAKEGNPQAAKLMFERVLATNNQDERAWLWLASIAKTENNDEGQQRYLETVLRINPKNAVAQKALAVIEQTRAKGQSRSLTFGLFVVVLLVVLVVGALLLAALLSRG